MLDEPTPIEVQPSTTDYLIKKAVDQSLGVGLGVVLTMIAAYIVTGNILKSKVVGTLVDKIGDIWQAHETETKKINENLDSWGDKLSGKLDEHSEDVRNQLLHVKETVDRLLRIMSRED